MPQCEVCGKEIPDRDRYCAPCFWRLCWSEELLNSPALMSRRERSHSTRLISLDREKPEAIFRASSDKSRTTYITTLDACTCRDFALTHGEIPCKHILRLGHELGLFHHAPEVLPEALFGVDAELIDKYLSILRFIARGRKILIKRLEESLSGMTDERKKANTIARLEAYKKFIGESREIKQYKPKDDPDELLDRLIKLRMIKIAERSSSITVMLPSDVTLAGIEKILNVYGENHQLFTHKPAKDPLKLLARITETNRRSEEILRPHNAVDTPEWAYRVPECFNTALDIKLMPRTKNFVEYFVWTQGAKFAFDCGDMIYRDNASYEKGTPALQVISGKKADVNYSDEVTYRDFEAGDVKTKTQIEFVKMLIGAKK